MPKIGSTVSKEIGRVRSFLRVLMDQIVSSFYFSLYCMEVAPPWYLSVILTIFSRLIKVKSVSFCRIVRCLLS